MTHTLPDTSHLSPQQVSAFADRELPPPETLAAELHLAACHACTLRILETMRLKFQTSSAANAIALPADALARLTAHLEPQQPRRRSAFAPAPWIALAACLLLALSLIGWRQFSRADTRSSELLDQHLAVLASGAAPEVLSTDRHTVKPWFQGRLPFSFNLPDALPPDTSLQGGNLTYVDGHPAALLLFTIRRHQVSLFLTQRTRSLPPFERSSTRSGFTVHYATTPDLHLAAVSDANPSDVDRLLAALTQAQER